MFIGGEIFCIFLDIIQRTHSGVFQQKNAESAVLATPAVKRSGRLMQRNEGGYFVLLPFIHKNNFRTVIRTNKFAKYRYCIGIKLKSPGSTE